MMRRDRRSRKEEADGVRASLAPGSLNGAITIVAILLFVALASAAMSDAVQHYFGSGAHTDQALAVALLLNIALILVGWGHNRHLLREVGVRTAAEERAHQLAAKDPLTGFLNRRSLAEAGAMMFTNVAGRPKAMALLLLDLDHFKMVNDLHGHATGDAIGQIYVSPVAGGWEAPKRLGGFAKVALAPGASKSASVTVDPRVLATWDEAGQQWRIAGGTYRVMLGTSAADITQTVTVTVPARTMPATWRAR